MHSYRVGVTSFFITPVGKLAANNYHESTITVHGCFLNLREVIIPHKVIPRFGVRVHEPHNQIIIIWQVSID
jgi:hypothetical protein